MSCIHVWKGAFNIIIFLFETKRHYDVCICKLYTHNLSCMLEWLYVQHDEKCHVRNGLMTDENNIKIHAVSLFALFL